VPLSGQLGIELKVSGTGEALVLDAEVKGDSLTWQPERQAPLRLNALELGMKGDHSGLHGSANVKGLGGTFELSLSAPALTLARLLRDPPSGTEWMAEAVKVKSRLDGLQLEELTQAGLLPRGVAGALSMQLDLHGSGAQPLGELRVLLKNGAAQGIQSADAELELTAAADELRMKLNAAREGRALAKVSGSFAAPLARLLAPAQGGSMEVVERTPFKLEGSFGPLKVAELRRQRKRRSAATPQAQAGLSGELAAAVTASGTLARPELQLTLRADPMAFADRPLGRAAMELRYAQREVKVTGSMDANGGTLQLEAHAEADLSLPAMRKGLDADKVPFEVSLKAKQLELGFLSGISPKEPELRGSLQWNEGRVALQGFGEYRQVELKLEATEKQITLSQLSANAGAGSLKLTGKVDRRAAGFGVNLKLSTQKLPIITDDQLMALASAEASLTGETGERGVFLELSIPEAHVELPEEKRKDLQALERPEDIVLTRNGRPVGRNARKRLEEKEKQVEEQDAIGGAGPAPEEKPQQLTVLINAPRNLWVKSADVQAELGLSEGFRFEMVEQPMVQGEVRVLRGRADVLGRRFDVQRDSQVRFAGPPASPYLNVTAQHVNEKEKVTIYVTVTGRGTSTTLKTSSQPPLSESEIFTLLTTGRRTLKRGSSGSSSSSAQAASVLGSVLASQLKGFLAKKLPLDVLSIEAGDEGITGTRVEAGTYLSDRVYVGWQWQVGADESQGENEHEIKMEYQITPRWSLESSVGKTAGAADIVWSRDY
jgi:translocation and assembly module TamB